MSASIAGLGEQRPERGGLGQGPILLVWFALVIGLVGGVLYVEERDKVNDPELKAQRGEIGALDGLSLWRESNVTRLVETVRGRLNGGKVVSLRLTPIQASVMVQDLDFSRRILLIDPGFGVDESDAGEAKDTGVPLAEIDATAPERIVRAVAAMASARPQDVDYLLLDKDEPGKPVQWSAFVKVGDPSKRGFFAAPDGGGVHRIGEPAPVSAIPSDAPDCGGRDCTP